MKRYLILSVFLIVVLVVVYFSYFKICNLINDQRIKSPDILREEILASISNPFIQADTLILETRWMVCGNNKPEEFPIVFDTQLDSTNYKNKLIGKLNLTVLTISEFHKVMDTVRINRFKGVYPPSLWDTCRVNKISAEIKAEALSNSKIRVYENYLYNDTLKYICKDFDYNEGKWTFKIVDKSINLK